MTLDSPSETELAFTLSDGRAHIESHPIFVGAEPTSAQLTSTYFDTPDRVLEKSGWSVRTRLQEHRRTQTVKGPTVAVSRPEWNTELDPCGRNLDFDKLRTTPVWPILDGHTKLLAPLFQTDLVRITRNLYFETARIEAAIDDGVLRSVDDENKTERIHDLELEMKDGEVGAMFRLAIELSLDAGIVMEANSKAQRGYQLVNGGAPQVRKHGDIALSKGTTTILGFQHILTDVITHLRQNLKAAHAGLAGGVHQVRVGLRRLRATLILFRKILHPETVRGYDEELRYFGVVFGNARDWDVFLTETLPAAVRDMPKATWLNLVVHVARDKQVESHIAVKREIEGSRFNSLMLSLMGWAEDYPLSSAPRRVYQRPIDEVMPALLTKVADKVAQRRQQLDDTPEAMHALRKSMKKLRYAVEFAASLYPNKAVRRYLRPCKDVQEVLGELNDVAATRTLIHSLTVSHPAVTPAIRELSVWLDQRERRAERPIARLLHNLAADKPFW